jgi:hypothetical protein
VIAVVPSVLTVVVVASVAHEAERDVTADSGSVTVKLTVTLPVLYQPFEPFGLAGVTTGVITGPVVSQIRVTEVVAVADELPAASVEIALMVFAPHASGTARREKEPRLKDAAEPLTVTLATPLVASFAVPLTSMVEAVVDDGRPPSATVGIVVSRLIVCVFEEVPPVLVAVQVITVVPSVLTVVVNESVGHEAERDVTADSESVTVKLTVMLPVLYQPFEPFGLAGVTTGVITGPVVSQIRVTEVLAVADELPAASVEIALMVFAPQASGTPRRENDGAVKVAAEPLTATLATPLVASFAVPLTSMVAAVVDDGRPPSATVGIVVSRLIVCVFVDVPPLLIAVQVIAVVPSVLTVVVVVSSAHEAERDVTADSESVTVKLTVTLPVLYQPFEPFGLAGVTTGVITGAVVSATNVMFVECVKGVLLS